MAFAGKTISMDYQWNRLTKVTLPNGIATDYSYNENSWLSAITTQKGTTTLGSSQYYFDNVGNITGKTTELGGHSYVYDQLYQITQATSPVLPQETFTYDKVGNRVTSQSSDQPSVTSYTHNANNEMTSYGAATITYDANGNTMQETENGQITKYIYNAVDRLEKVELPDGRTATYKYDPFGRRIKKQILPSPLAGEHPAGYEGQGEGETTYFTYADEGLVGEYDTSGNLKKAYGWMPDSIWGTDPIFMLENGQYYYYHNDHLGTPQKMTDASGNVVWSAKYTAFGEAVVDITSTVTNNLRYPGQYYDDETGLHYNQQRYYDPKTGRYTQVDPIGFEAQDENLYRYVGNGPLNDFDPDGEFGVIGALGGAGFELAAQLIGNGGR